MTDFSDYYTALNDEQRQAVDYIDGPLLVIAGPGTGKTQLLSARVANILQNTDTLPENILCLTFTDMAAFNMRERLSQMIGEAAYDVHIATYHSFGSDIIRSYPDYFSSINMETGEDARLERPIDEITKTKLLTEIIQSLPYDDPLRSATYYIGSVDSTITDLKRATITPDQLRKIASENIAAVQALSAQVNTAFENTNMRSFDSCLQGHTALHAAFENTKSSSVLVTQGKTALEAALNEATETHSTKPLTAWRGKWLSKDETGAWTFTDVKQHLKVASLAKVYETYQARLTKASLYDFDDMILSTIQTLANNTELRSIVQERYQYILLDEFQDTNAAQFEMVHLIANHPVHEGRPNIMAVGDDDQAIYAFQGAEISNMVEFTKKYQDTLVINLKKNYRSHHDIIEVAHNISAQIETRLTHTFTNIQKELVAASDKLPRAATIERHEFSSQASECSWIAEQVASLIKSGVDPREIAVLSPKHKQLEELVPLLNSKDIPVTYEKREDILTTPIVRQLRMMSELVLALHSQNHSLANYYFPQVLSFAFFNIPPEVIWKINWQQSKYDESRSWAEIALETPELTEVVKFFLALANMVSITPLEYMLDYLSGTQAVQMSDEAGYTSPLKDYYFRSHSENSQKFYETLSYLSIIRSHLRNFQQGSEVLLSLQDFTEFFALYEAANKPLLNSHPISQDAASVQLMTVYKAKGLEYEYVFLLSLQDDVWGKKSRSNTNKIALPQNLQSIRYIGTSEDERKRLLFVAVTRAKHGLYLTSYATTETGKPTEPVKYLQEQVNDSNTRTVGILNDSDNTVQVTNFSAQEAYQHIEQLWQQRHVHFSASLRDLLQERLQRYQMSPTHLNSFIDTEYGGPESFLLATLLRFPSAPSVDGEYGSAVHASLEWYQKQENPNLTDTLEYFTQKIERAYIPKSQVEHLRSRGTTALTKYLEARPNLRTGTNLPEVDFRSEGVTIGEAKLTGKIDRLEIDEASKSIRIVDFKTGKAHTSWKKDLKLLKYEQQLYFYMLLIEKSHTYSKYTITDARLEFVEPSLQGSVSEPLILKFDQKKYDALKELIQAVWTHIHELNLPSIDNYSPDYNGSMSFQNDLLS